MNKFRNKVLMPAVFAFVCSFVFWVGEGYKVTWDRIWQVFPIILILFLLAAWEII